MTCAHIMAEIGRMINQTRFPHDTHPTPDRLLSEETGTEARRQGVPAGLSLPEPFFPAPHVGVLTEARTKLRHLHCQPNRSMQETA